VTKPTTFEMIFLMDIFNKRNLVPGTKNMKFLILALFLFFSSFVSSKDLNLDDDVTCFAVTLYFEARGEILAASVGTAEVILTRIKSKFYDDNACDVVTSFSVSPKTGKIVCAFEWYCNLDNLFIDLSDPIESKAWQQAKHLAKSYLSTTPPIFTTVKNASLFHDTSMTPDWARSPNVRLVAIIGNLKFYEEFRSGILISKKDTHIKNGRS